MSYLRLLAVCGFVLVISSCRKAAVAPPEGVSIIQLLAAPRTWDGKLVRTIGFLRLEFEGDALYLHEQDFRHRISDNGVRVDLPQEFPGRAGLSMNYVLVEGVFQANDPKDAASFGGTITAVRRAEIWSTPQNPGARFQSKSQ